MSQTSGVGHEGAAKIPGPHVCPIVGETGNIAVFMLDSLAYLNRLAAHGDIAGIARGKTSYVFVFGPRYNEEVLTNVSLFHNLDTGSFPLRLTEGGALGRLLGGLTNMNGGRHREHRRAMAGPLHRRGLSASWADVVDLTQREAAGWKIGQRRDFYQDMRRLTLRVAVKTLLGLDPSAGGDRLAVLLERWIKSVFSVPAMLLPAAVPGFPYHRLLSLSDVLASDIHRLIEQKREQQEVGTDVLSMLLRPEDDAVGLNEDELVGHTAFLFMAGHTTTASALAWTLFLLSQHPTVANALRDELDGKLGGAPPTLEQLCELPLLAGVVKESMRLLPPVLWWARVSTAPFRLGPYDCPAGTRVIFSAYATHRLPALYARPDRFLPERWQTIKPTPYAYLPFSAGPRTCLGSRLATMEMQVILAMLLQRFGLPLAPRARVHRSGPMLLYPRRGLPVIITPAGRSSRRSAFTGNVRKMVSLN